MCFSIVFPAVIRNESCCMKQRRSCFAYRVTLSSTHFIAGMEFGIDVSHHSGSIDWDCLRSDKVVVDFVLVKGSEGGTWKDPEFKHNFESARFRRFRTGYYHHFRTMFAGKPVSVKDQVNLIGRQLEAVNFDTEKNFFVLNVERTTRDAGLTHGRDRMSRHQLSHRIKSLLFQINQKYGVNGIIYTNKSFWDEFVHTHDVDLSHHGLWIARFANLPGGTMIQRLREVFQHTFTPSLPNGFSRTNYWQFCTTGTIDGIRGDVNCSILYDHRPSKNR